MDFFKNLFKPTKPKDQLYSIERNAFNFQKINDFWKAIEYAQKAGITGKDKKIAVLDIGFDLSYPALKAQTKRYRNYSPRKTKVRHGNTVALLILEVAPKAELYLFDIGKNGSPNADFLDLAIEEILEIGVDIVNLSWGKKIPKKVHSATEKAIEHCSCYVCSRIKPLAEKVLVVTSVGNDTNYQYCPSTVPNVYNAGFQYERIYSEASADGGSHYMAEATQPLQYSQSLNTHFTIMQPEHLIGSSFASPLFAGVLALMENPRNELLYFLVNADYSAQAASLFSSSHTDHTILQKRAIIEKLFLKGLRTNPHGFYCNQKGFCFECSIFSLDGYQNLALLYLNSSQFANANNLALHAINIAPFSAHSYSTLATSIRVQVEEAIYNKTVQWTAISNLEDAIDLYKKAIDRKPENVEVYKEGQDKCYELLKKLKG